MRFSLLKIIKIFPTVLILLALLLIEFRRKYDSMKIKLIINLLKNTDIS